MAGNERKHLAKRWYRAGMSGGLSLQCSCGEYEPIEGTVREQEAAHRAHRVAMGEVVKDRVPSKLDRVTAERDAVLAELAAVQEELAELKASNEPRLRCLLLKAAPDRDLYVGWSNVCEMPAGVWSREEAVAYGFPPSRLARAEATGTSSYGRSGAWGSSGFVAEQRGFLRRDRLGDYAVAYCGGDHEAAFAMLEPFDDDDDDDDWGVDT